MTELVCKPLKEPVVKGKGVYAVYMNRTDLGLRVRARNAAEADLMLQTCFRHELPGKTLDFDLKSLIECKENTNEDGKSENGGEPEESEDPEGH